MPSAPGSLRPSQRSSWPDAARIAAGPFAVPLPYDTVFSYGTGSTWKRAASGATFSTSVPRKRWCAGRARGRFTTAAP